MNKEYTKEQKLHIIQEVMSDKTPYGYFKKQQLYGKIINKYKPTEENNYLLYDVSIPVGNEGLADIYKIYIGDYYKIIGHPVMIGDVLEIYREPTQAYHTLLYWRKINKPIEDQSEECISFIYNLIKDDTTKQ